MADGHDGNAERPDPDAPTRVIPDEEAAAEASTRVIPDGEAPADVAPPSSDVRVDTPADAPTRVFGAEDEAPGPIRPAADTGEDELEPTRVAGAGEDELAATRVAGAGEDELAPTRVAERRPKSGSPPTVGGGGGTLRSGTVLFGEYEIVDVLGSGGMGEVYRARHRRLDEFRAIKVMHADLSGRTGASEFFDREAKALLAVRHPAVVHCHDLLSDESGRVFLVMEMIEGQALADRISRGPLSADEVAVLGARIGEGLAAAHARGVIHRDVSPDNIVLPGGRVADAKLIDFGIAKLLEEGGGTIIDGFKGKLGYASPEQLGFFEGRIDGRSDFYSLGLVLCAAALGRPIGMGSTVVEAVDARRRLHSLPAEIPIGLRSALMPLLALDPKDRPAHVERLFVGPGVAVSPRAHDVAGSPPTASAAAGSTELSPASGSPKSTLALSLAAAVVVLGAGALWWNAGDAGEAPPAAPAGATAVEESSGTAAPGADAQATATKPSTPAEPVAKKPAAKPTSRAKVSALDRVRIAGLLGGAEAALSEDRLSSPPGDNAAEKYRAVLRIEPTNAEATRGLRAVANRYVVLGRAALETGALDRADEHIKRATQTDPNAPGLPALKTAWTTAASKN